MQCQWPSEAQAFLRNALGDRSLVLYHCSYSRRSFRIFLPIELLAYDQLQNVEVGDILARVHQSSCPISSQPVSTLPLLLSITILLSVPPGCYTFYPLSFAAYYKVSAMIPLDAETHSLLLTILYFLHAIPSNLFISCSWISWIIWIQLIW